MSLRDYGPYQKIKNKIKNCKNVNLLVNKMECSYGEVGQYLQVQQRAA